MAPSAVDDAALFAVAEDFRAGGGHARTEALYCRILRRNPDHLAALQGRARSLAALGRGGEAEDALRMARQVEAADLCNVAHAALRHGRVDAAVTCCRRALKIAPGMPEATWGLAETWFARGNTRQALLWYQKYLTIEPGNPEARHLVAALGGGPMPARADDGYVRALFDRFAADFDHQLVDDLKYSGPELLLGAVRTVLPAAAKLRVLDLGCGTGLAGQKFRGLAGRLDGIDLSPEMVGLARARNIYDTLTVAEATRALAAMDAAYDLIVAADVLIYFGDLTAILEAAAGVLAPGGLFALTVEWRSRGVRLTGSGRFAHSPAHVRRVARKAAMTVVYGEGATIR